MKHVTSRSAGNAGFTLIELMITVAIVSILAAIAYPSYTTYVQRGYRAAAKSQLLQAEQYMKRFYAANDSYSTDRGGTGVALPDRLRRSPPEAAEGSQLYSITVPSSDGTSFTVTAAPAGAMTGDKCGSFTIDQTGRKGVQNNTATRDECWR